jgi:hypothetical protein
VDSISVGALTHSVVASDVSLEMAMKNTAGTGNKDAGAGPQGLSPRQFSGLHPPQSQGAPR